MPEAIAIVGTTAAGKSALAMALARHSGRIEIVSVDSMAVYRGMDLATAKPSQHDRREVPHHLIDVLDPSEECSVSLFKSLAHEAIAEIQAAGRIPLLVGGTGLYHRAVIDDLEIPGSFPALRAQLETVADDPDGLAVLMARLEELDPLAAGRIEPGNARRIVRALEVIEGTGRPFSSFGPGLETYTTSRVLQIGLAVPGELVDRRIEARVEDWMAAGLLEEVTALLARPRGLSRTARQAIGYRELLEVVEGGADVEAAVASTIQRTKAFARRQRAWFRRDPRVAWQDSAEQALAALEGALERMAPSAKVRN